MHSKNKRNFLILRIIQLKLQNNSYGEQSKLVRSVVQQTMNKSVYIFKTLYLTKSKSVYQLDKLSRKLKTAYYFMKTYIKLLICKYSNKPLCNSRVKVIYKCKVIRRLLNTSNSIVILTIMVTITFLGIGLTIITVVKLIIIPIINQGFRKIKIKIRILTIQPIQKKNLPLPLRFATTWKIICRLIKTWRGMQHNQLNVIRKGKFQG